MVICATGVKPIYCMKLHSGLMMLLAYKSSLQIFKRTWNFLKMLSLTINFTFFILLEMYYLSKVGGNVLAFQDRGRIIMWVRLMKRGPGLSKTEDTKVGAPSYLTAHVKFISQNAGQTHLAHPLWSVTFLFLLYFFPENFFPVVQLFLALNVN